MKFTISSSYLYKHLVALYGAVVSNPLLPILENFLFEITNGKLKITASDLQTSIITELPLDVTSETAVAVPAKILLDTLKNLPEQPIKFHIEEGAYTISIHSDTGRYNLAGENAADFPTIPAGTSKISISLPAAILKRAIQQTIIATSHDELKPAINGVYMDFQDHTFTFVATDIHRLIRYVRTDINSIEQPPFILPRKTLLLLTSLLTGDQQEEVKFSFSNGNAHFQIANTRIVARLIDEKYPDYESVIPKNNPNKLEISRGELLAALRRIIVYTNKITHQVKFTLAEKKLHILAEDFNFDNKAHEELTCEYEGQLNLEIGFNTKSLIELLHNLDADEVTFYFSQATQGNQANKAAIITPSKQEKGEDILLLVMPVILH
jgi:DNA polymerase-3 subunit beta